VEIVSVSVVLTVRVPVVVTVKLYVVVTVRVPVVVEVMVYDVTIVRIRVVVDVTVAVTVLGLTKKEQLHSLLP